MRLSWFIIIGVILLLILFIILLKNNDKHFLNKAKNKSYRWYYLVGLALLGVSAVATVNHYIYPKDKEIFCNADYHILEHKGFVFDSLLYLVRSNYPSNDFPEEALWDNKTGTIILTHDSIKIQNYYEPFFVANKFENYNVWDKFPTCKGTKENSNYFRLCNKIINIDISEGFTLTRNGEILYSLQIAPFVDKNKRKKCYYISQSAQNPADTSSFTQPINIGYPLTDIIAHSYNFKFSDELRELFDGAVLVRENIPFDNKYGREKKEENRSALVFMPNSTFFNNDDIQINGNYISQFNSDARFVIPLQEETLFYSGIGRTKTDIIRIKPDERNKVSLRYVLPKMQKLRKQDGQLFVTSSIDEAVSAKMNGGYLHNIFESESNFNHINARIRYFIGSSRDSLFIETMDLYADNPTEKNIVIADDEFYLQTRGKVNHDVQWVFNLKNLRETNSLEWKHILLFIVVFILLVGLRLLIDNIANTNSLSILELSVYVVVFCFSIVRLVLGWRMSTFVPTEDIDATVFAKMRDGFSVLQTTCVSLTLPVLFQVISFLKIKLDINKIKEMKISHICILIVFALILGVCHLVSENSDYLSRFFNIPIPIITFFLFNLWLLIKLEKNGNNYTPFKRALPQVLLWSITLVYLFLRDAGFSIIFLMYSIIHFLIIAKLIDKNENRFKLKKFYKSKVFAITFFSAVFILFLRFEGDLLIAVFNFLIAIFNLKLTLVFSLFLAVLCLCFFRKADTDKKRWIAFFFMSFAVFIFIFSILEMTGTYDFANSKTHIKFRAEVQKLKPDEAIDDLMLRSDFNSEDIVYIMRSAHNQWFINQYNNDNIADTKYFNLQPHFNQGSTFTTQTTDLVITRYVLAEHGEWLLFWLMSMLLLLLVIYSYEVTLESKTNFTMLGVFILLFVITLFVFLSATNRIVFFGQDFPFLSITSRIAVIFPIGLFFIAVWKLIIDRKNSIYDYGENGTIQARKLWIPFILGTLTLTCVLFPQQGKEQTESQFDVSKIISSITEKTELLNREFIKFQNSRGTNNWSMDSIWNAYTNPTNEVHSEEWKAAVNDSASNNIFFSSLLKYFDEKQLEKNNPNELLHLRKRNGIYRLCINKKHYFIPSVMREDIQWTGEILSAKTDRYFGFSKISSTEITERLNTDIDYESDILPPTIDTLAISNIRISRFDTSWVADKEPLLLITSKQGKGEGSKQFYHIETESMSIKGNSTANQLATRINQNDLVLLNTSDRKGIEKNVLAWKYGQKDEHFLAKNIWLNGKRQLFYPLGKEFMWSYTFANHVANTYKNIPEYKDSTIRVSIDYDLHKQLYSIINSENKNKINLNKATIKQLNDFKELNYQKQKSLDNRMSFHYDIDQSQIVYDNVNPDLKKGIDRVNLKIKKHLKTRSPESAIAEAIDEVVEKQFDYSAVVIDGNGRIRALFDYSKNRKIDPNNIKYLYRFLSNLYKESDNSTERDVFGNNALQFLNPGPASSFKPIAYSAITSYQQFPWERLSLTRNFLNEALHQSVDENENKKFEYYGGVQCTDVGESPWSLDYNNAFSYDNYLTYSNNLYHSVMIMFGMQRSGRLMDILKAPGNDAYAFPVITLDGTRYSFDKEKWYKGGNMEVGMGIMSSGLKDNFNIYEEMVDKTNLYSNYFGEEAYLSILFKQKSDWRGWVYTETGSQNNPDRNLPPFIRNGLIQMSLGSYPLEVSPLQMATMAMRLASLNRSPNITTLSDSVRQIPSYEFFRTPTWRDSTAYFNFYKRQVLVQLRKVPKVGTARSLNHLVEKYEAQGYYIYAKTGTLNLPDKGNERLKSLLVIISNTPLENVSSITDLQKVKYYVLYLSYIGIDKYEFGSTNRFGKVISATIESELFKKYMNSK